MHVPTKMCIEENNIHTTSLQLPHDHNDASNWFWYQDTQTAHSLSLVYSDDTHMFLYEAMLLVIMTKKLVDNKISTSNWTQSWYV